MITRLDHVGISVRDMDKAIAFYRDVIGMELAMDREFDTPLARIIGTEGACARVVHMKLGNSVVELFQYSAPEGRDRLPDHNQSDYGLIHAGFLVDDFQAEYDRLRELGVEFLGESVEIRPDVFVAYFYGVEGEVLEIRKLADG
jgi:catechol 2,3-dioxygenase-like lactoylglutathione lyase family enzyme